MAAILSEFQCVDFTQISQDDFTGNEEYDCPSVSKSTIKHMFNNTRTVRCGYYNQTKTKHN